jgi:hypothetical protein
MANKTLSRNVLGRDEENYEKPGQKSKFQGRDFHLGPPEYKVGVLTT